MERPKKIPRKTRVDNCIELLTLLSFLGAFGLLFGFYTQLPDQIPLHFNWPSKNAAGEGPKVALFFLPVILSILSIGIYWLNRYPWVLNYPIKITNENAQKHYTIASQMLRWLNLLMGLTTLALTYSSLTSVFQWPFSFQSYLYPALPIVFTGLPLLFLALFFLKKMGKEKTSN